MSNPLPEIGKLLNCRESYLLASIQPEEYVELD